MNGQLKFGYKKYGLDRLGDYRKIQIFFALENDLSGGFDKKT